jgi:hypothetical protein
VTGQPQIPDDIRSLYVETLARAEYERCFGAEGYRWETTTESIREAVRRDFTFHVDALAEKGLLPIGAGYRWVYEPDGTPLGYRERHLFTDWREVAAPCSGCGVTERRCGRWRGGGKCCPDCRHPLRKEPGE